MDWIARHWYVGLLLLAVGIAIGIGRSAGPTPDDPTPSTGGDATQEALRKKFEGALSEQATRTTSGGEKSTDEVISDHQARLEVLEDDPKPDESAALLSALGNLHMQKKRDYATAARYYEELIQKYPDWPGINAVFHQLISCYTQLDDQPSLRILYRKMVEFFPSDSKEYEYAAAALAGEL